MKEIEKLAKEAEELFKKAILVPEDYVEIKKIREEFKRESEEGMRVVYGETKKKYILAEINYLKNIKQQRTK